MRRHAYACVMAAACMMRLAWAGPAVAGEIMEIRTAAQLSSSPKFVQQGAGQVAGLCVDIHRAIERIDPSLRIVGDQTWRPLPRIEAEVRKGGLDIACGLLRNKEREASYHYLDTALFSVTYFLVARADDDVEINSWDDVRGLGDKGTILLIHGFGPIARLKEIGGLQLDSGGSDARTNLMKLMAGRGRFYYHRSPGIATEIRQAALEGKVRVLPTVMDLQRFHMVAGKHVAQETLDKLRRALAQLEASGELKRLFSRWYDDGAALGALPALARYR
ncbi:substrate-binding periplasmic protein [Pseudoduganella namucuonensis]|uniref:ABC-type amino acid transport substrate-binding protein n=1 Tax=Pseudoduganella namucuonensis TaxID=1035707 RepID=A0A1I7KWC0_9BURK|nr:ABC transporter substrate-binding protein [Pseudoduganella namucuonensis]SFV01720.1 ABC-type amino acid transport substrate-binding protein [Pseudoduganella namucuonensis]